MPLAILFWMLFVIWALFEVFPLVVPAKAPSAEIQVRGRSLLLFVLIGLLGWATFGEIVQG
jgi:hypothetical protein